MTTRLPIPTAHSGSPTAPSSPGSPAATHLSHVRIRHFQSLHDVSLDLAPLTVIVGPSSSGKSAFTRALRTLVSNRRGTDFISTGERTCSITATTDAGTVTLTRSRTTSSTENAYVLTPADDPTQQQTYTKLGGETPSDVSRFLGIPADQPINFASQFDKPFLLADSAADAARTLGDLTNVSLVFDAARESNRRKLQANSTLKLRAQDLAAVKERIPGIRDLKAQAAALERAEEALAAARSISANLEALERALGAVQALEDALPDMKRRASMEVPSENRVVEALSALQGFTEDLRRVTARAGAVRAAESNLEAVEATLSELDSQLSEITGDLTRDVRGYLDAHVQPVFVRDGFVELGHAADVFTQYLSERTA